MFFAPASLTCLFSPKISEPRDSGSMGISLALKKGARVTVERSDRLEVFLNGERVKFGTLETIAERLGFVGRIVVNADLPVGCGFGMSGASALAAALAIDPNSPLFELADLAHEAEVLNRTGLGDVVTQCYGGVVVRLTPACPSVCRVEKFLWSFELDVLILGELDTREVLSEFPLEKIADVGRSCLKEFLRRPNLDSLFEQSKRFSTETGLIELDSKVEDAVEAVEAEGGKASMVMLGRGVFAFGGDVLKEFDGIYIKVGIDNCGVRSLD